MGFQGHGGRGYHAIERNGSRGFGPWGIPKKEYTSEL